METSQTLSQAAKRRGLLVILLGTFLMWGGFFMVIPLLSVQYVDRLGWTAAAVGVVLGVRQLVQQGLTVVGGALADRLGAKGLIWIGLLIRSIGFAGMAFATNFPLLMFTALLSGLGGALFDAPRMAALTALTDEQNRSRVFSIAGVVGGVGMTAGPLLGALLLRVDFAFVSLAAAACFFIAFLATLLFLPSIQVSTERHNLTYGVRMAANDRPFVLFIILLMGYWFMWVQLTISLPLVAKNISGTADAVGWMYTLNAGMMVLLQYPLLRLAERWLQPMPILVIGMVLMAAGLGSIALIGNLALLLVCVALFSIGSLLVMPTHQTVIAKLSNPAAVGSYFGVSALALALGGGIGNVSGGLLYDLGVQMQMPALPWIIFCVVGLASAAGLWMMHVRREASSAKQRAQNEQYAVRSS